MRERQLPASAAETAHYIERIAGDLEKMSLQAGMPFLGYLLAMARQEASEQSLKQRDN